MGIFGDDQLQDERLDALEAHVRVMTETIQANQVDIAASWIAILALQAQVDEKISASEVDPAIGDMNQKLGEAREQLAAASDAAADSWVTLQKGVRESFETLRTSVRDASERLGNG